MKNTPENIILNQKEINLEKNVFLISGNEETLIKKIEKVLILKLKNKGFLFVQRKTDKHIDLQNYHELSAQLFSEKEIIIYENPKEVNLASLDKMHSKNTAIIITHNKINNSSKMKRDFDSHTKFISISCYALNKETKINFLNNFLYENKIDLDKESYWFFLENSADEYLLFENEMYKFLLFNKKQINIKEMVEIISSSQKKITDNIFFLLLNNSKEIILKTRKVVSSQEDSYLLLSRTKFFFNLIVGSTNINDALKNFPKYLFRERNLFKELFSKTNKTKALKIFILIKKSELLIRKHNFIHLSVIQRLFLNIKQIIK